MIPQHATMIQRLVGIVATASPTDFSNQDDPLSDSLVGVIAAVYFGVCGEEINQRELHQYHLSPDGFYGIFDPQQLMGMALDVVQQKISTDALSVEQFVDLIRDINPPFTPVREFLFEVRPYVPMA